jgi:hypothetical protein
MKMNKEYLGERFVVLTAIDFWKVYPPISGLVLFLRET